MRVEVRPGVAVTLAGKPVTADGAAVGRGRRHARRAVAGRADHADHRPRRPAGRAPQGHEEPGARRVQGAALLPDRSALPRRRDVRAAREAGLAQRSERARDGREHAQPRLRVVRRSPACPPAQPLRLDAVLEPGETQLFFIFRDATSGKTHLRRRAVPVRGSARDGKVVLDFNRAYSPPCAFTPHATCPLPPPTTGCRWRSRRGRCSPGTLKDADPSP